MDKIIHVSAPGKIIVFGEHAVVYGKQALAASLDLRTELTISSNNENVINLNLPSININLSFSLVEIQKIASFSNPEISQIFCPCEDVDNLKKFAGFLDGGTTKDLAVVAFLHLFRCILLKNLNQELEGMNISVTSLIPASAGLGSSAAYSVCLAAGFLAYLHHFSKSSPLITSTYGLKSFENKDLDLINGWAFVAEKIIHGKSSGIDNSVSTFGRAMWYKHGQFLPVENMPNLKVLLINTKISRNTKTLVEKVRLKRDKYPLIIEPLFDSIEAISETFKLKLLDANTSTEFHQDLTELISMNERLLELLGVGHDAILKICCILRDFHLEGKLTGAGGGGCVFAFIPSDYSEEMMNELKKKLTALNFDSFFTSLGGPGVHFY